MLMLFGVCRRWGMQCLGYNNVPANLHRGVDYVPDIVYFAAATPSSVVIAFTGAQFCYKIDRGEVLLCT